MFSNLTVNYLKNVKLKYWDSAAGEGFHQLIILVELEYKSAVKQRVNKEKMSHHGQSMQGYPANPQNAKEVRMYEAS